MRKDPGVAKTRAVAAKVAKAISSAEDLVLLPDQQFQQLADQASPFYGLQGNANAYWQQNLGMTTQVLPGVAGAQSFNAQQLTQTAAIPGLLATHPI
jgi:hypothetical protein